MTLLNLWYLLFRWGSLLGHLNKEMHSLSLTDDEYFCYALAARRFQGPFVITALFREFAESYSSLEVHETTSTCSFLMSIEGHNPSGCYLTP